MVNVSFFRFGLRYNENATVPGAQTERRGEAGPVSVLLRGWDSPAAFFVGCAANYGQSFFRTLLVLQFVPFGAPGGSCVGFAPGFVELDHVLQRFIFLARRYL